MVQVKSEGIILERTDLDFESQAVLNPACLVADGVTHMFYRAVSPGNFSSIGYCQLDSDNKVLQRHNKPLIVPEHDYEKHGVEDPRIVEMDGVYYLLYVAFDGKNAAVAYATSSDLISFEKRGIISPQIAYDAAIEVFKVTNMKPEYEECKFYCEAVGGKDILLWDKDAYIFPKKFDGKFAMIHRILPDIQIAYFEKFEDLNQEYWKQYIRNLKNYIVLQPRFEFEYPFIGAGCPPVETEEGWLMINHGVQEAKAGNIYRATATLLDKENPQKVVGRLTEPLFEPKEEWEIEGDVNNVVFPTGTVERDGRLIIFYGAADKLIAAKSVDLGELISELKKS